MIPALLNKMWMPPNSLNRPFDDALAVRRAGNICPFEPGASAVAGDFCLDRLAAGLIYVRDDDRSALACEQEGGRPPDAGSGAGDDGDLVVKLMLQHS